MLSITPTELNTLIEKDPTNIELIDVRRSDEFSEYHIAGARNIPLHILPIRMHEIDTKKQVIFICRSGGRSGQACELALKSSIQGYNLIGWTNWFESEFPSKIVYWSKQKITLYSKDYCPYCVMAKNLLSSIGADFEEIDITNKPEMIGELVKKSGMRTVPQIFIWDTCLGGYDDISGLHQRWELLQKIGL